MVPDVSCSFSVFISLCRSSAWYSFSVSVYYSIISVETAQRFTSPVSGSLWMSVVMILLCLCQYWGFVLLSSLDVCVQVEAKNTFWSVFDLISLLSHTAEISSLIGVFIVRVCRFIFKPGVFLFIDWFLYCPVSFYETLQSQTFVFKPKWPYFTVCGRRNIF